MEYELGVQAKGLKSRGVPLLLSKVIVIKAQYKAMKELIGELDHGPSYMQK